MEATEIPDKSWETLAKAGDFPGAIEAFVREQDWVSFVQLQSRFEGYMPVKGTFALGLPDLNVFFWFEMSEALIDAIDKLRVEKRLFIYPTTMLVYMADGGWPRVPIAKVPPPGGYKTEHWFPTCLRVVPNPVPKRKKGAPR